MSHFSFRNWGNSHCSTSDRWLSSGEARTGLGRAGAGRVCCVSYISCIVFFLKVLENHSKTTDEEPLGASRKAPEVNRQKATKTQPKKNKTTKKPPKTTNKNHRKTLQKHEEPPSFLGFVAFRWVFAQPQRFDSGLSSDSGGKGGNFGSESHQKWVASIFFLAFSLIFVLFLHFFGGSFGFACGLGTLKAFRSMLKLQGVQLEGRSQVGQPGVISTGWSFHLAVGQKDATQTETTGSWSSSGLFFRTYPRYPVFLTHCHLLFTSSKLSWERVSQ